MSLAALNILKNFPVITPRMEVQALPWTGGKEFYEGLDRHFGGFENHVLVSCHEFDEPWPTWECHPMGDEIVILLSGSAKLTLLFDGGETDVALAQPGEFAIVPRGTWHTATAASNARMLFITPGEGTENKLNPVEKP